MKALYVSVNETYKPGDSTLASIALDSSAAWRISRSKAEECAVVVAMYKGTPLAAWELVGTYTHDHDWDSTGHMKKKRTGLLYGQPIPLDPRLHRDPPLRSGVTVVEIQ